MNTDWTTQLAPEHAPVAPGWWPPAPGWWAASLVLLALIAAAILWWRNPRRRLQRSTLRELQRIRSTPADLTQTAQAIQNLLRRYALARFGHDGVAALAGGRWLEFLGDRGTQSLGGTAGESLLATAYGARPADNLDRDRWLVEAERFVRRGAARRAGPASGAKRGARGLAA
jgi:hypothetical protein